MNFAERFLKHLEIRGLSIRGPKPDDPPDRLYLIGPTSEKTPEILDGLRKFKPQLLERYGRRPDGDRGEPQPR